MVLSAVGGTLVALSLFLAVLVAVPYQFFNSMPPGITSLNSLDNRFLFVSASMLIVALAAVAQWDGLVLDARDTAVLGVLPIRRVVIVRTKFIATALFAAAVLVAWNLFPTLLRVVALPTDLRIGFVGVAWLTLAHAVATVAAGAFGFLAVLGVREVAFAILGATAFRRISAALQAALIVGLTTALLLLPGASSGVARNWLAQGGATARALPPMWFVGLHETLPGSVIDSLPRTLPSRPLRLIRAELAATNLYRRLWPLYEELAVIAAGALFLVAAATSIACLWNNRRLPQVAGAPVSKSRAVTPGRHWIVVHVLARTPLRQAGFFFTLQTLSRRVSHRVAMATAWAMGLALTIVAVSGERLVAVNDVRSIPVAILAAQSLLLGSVLNGFRRATRISAELRGGSTFSLAWRGKAAPYISGVKRAGWIAVVAPALLGLTIWHTVILGPRIAALHFGVGVLISALFMETIFFHTRRVPFVTTEMPSIDVKLRVFGFLAMLLFVSFALAWVERSSFSRPRGHVALLTALAGLSLLVAAVSRTSGPARTLDLDEQPLLPTQRLNLAE